MVQRGGCIGNLGNVLTATAWSGVKAGTIDPSGLLFVRRSVAERLGGGGGIKRQGSEREREERSSSLEQNGTKNQLQGLKS